MQTLYCLSIGKVVLLQNFEYQCLFRFASESQKKQKKIMSVCAIPIFTIQLSVYVVLVKSLFFNSICLLFGSSCYVV